MEVIEKSVEGLAREFTVKVTAMELDSKLTEKLEEIKGEVHLKGFRPGKAPVSFLKKMYGKGMMQELVQETITEANTKALDERELRPATPPHPHFKDGLIDDVVAGSADLEYDMHVEVLPDFDPMDVANLNLTRLVADVPREDIDEALENIASENKTYEPRDKGAQAEEGDKLKIDFTGRIGEEEFEGGKAEGADLTLGSGNFIPGFEEQLVGAKEGDESSIEVTFPEDYGAKDLAGKAAIFDIKVHEVAAPQEVKIDDALALSLGFDDLTALEKAVTERLEEGFKSQGRQHLKRAILDKLDEAHDFDLPKGMVDAEFDQIWQQIQSAELDDEDKDKSEEDLKAEYLKIAERRVRLGLVLAEIGKANEIDIAQEEMSRALHMQAQQFGMPVQQLAEIYQNNPQALAQLRAPLFEDKVVDYIIERAEVTEETVSKEQLMKDPED